MVLTRHRLAHESPESCSSGADVHRRECRTGLGEMALKESFISIYFLYIYFLSYREPWLKSTLLNKNSVSSMAV